MTKNFGLDLVHSTTGKVPEDLKQVNPTLLLVQLANSPPSADTGQLQHPQFNGRTVQNLEKTQPLRKMRTVQGKPDFYHRVYTENRVRGGPGSHVLNVPDICSLFQL